MKLTVPVAGVQHRMKVGWYAMLPQISSEMNMEQASLGRVCLEGTAAS